jgi:release factor glutamine methyltransferase
VAEEPDVWTVKRVLSWASDDLRSRASESPRLEAELLLAQTLGLTRVGLVLAHDRPLEKDELATYRALHVRRRNGEPVAYLRKEREFFGRPFRVDARVLVPRPETELLVEVGLARTREASLSARILDLCTGSGCVAITLAKERPTTRVLGTDISGDALVVARDNAVRLGALPAVSFRRSDLFDDLGSDEPFDLVTANPPYIPARERDELPRSIVEFEPHVALFGGEDGFDVTARIVDGAPAHLAPRGVLAMEIGAGQSRTVAERLEARGYVAIEIRRDYAGIERIVSAVWPGRAGGADSEGGTDR